MLAVLDPFEFGIVIVWRMPELWGRSWAGCPVGSLDGFSPGATTLNLPIMLRHLV